jgi:hypothetical protein
MSAVIDARMLFGSLQLEARTRRFKTEVAAFERQTLDRLRTRGHRLRPHEGAYSFGSMEVLFHSLFRRRYGVG